MKHLLLISFAITLSLPSAFCQDEKKAVLNVVNKFFATLESQDSTLFQSLHIKGARFYIVAQQADSARIAMRDVSSFTFNKTEIIKERMRDTGVVVQIHDRIAMVWAPYDLWVNEKLSHSGVDVFTLLKSNSGWKIATIGYTIEK